MAKYDRLVISGEQLKEIDAGAIARVIIMLARRLLRNSGKESQQETSEEGAS